VPRQCGTVPARAGVRGCVAAHTTPLAPLAFTLAPGSRRRWAGGRRKSERHPQSPRGNPGGFARGTRRNEHENASPGLPFPGKNAAHAAQPRAQRLARHSPHTSGHLRQEPAQRASHTQNSARRDAAANKAARGRRSTCMCGSTGSGEQVCDGRRRTERHPLLRIALGALGRALGRPARRRVRHAHSRENSLSDVPKRSSWGEVLFVGTRTGALSLFIGVTAHRAVTRERTRCLGGGGGVQRARWPAPLP